MRDSLADERLRLRMIVGPRLQRARAALAAGADTGTTLADMLVPNVRPDGRLRESCTFDEIDRGAGVEELEDWVAGTKYEGRIDEFIPVLESLAPKWPGAECNAEFRGRFAAHLRLRLTARQLREAYFFLGARWRAFDPSARRYPLISFAGTTRRPPLQWIVGDELQRTQILRWTRRVPVGRALQQATDEFWRDSELALGDFERTCPNAAARWSYSRARLVAMIDEESARREAAAGRTSR